MEIAKIYCAFKRDEWLYYICVEGIVYYFLYLETYTYLSILILSLHYVIIFNTNTNINNIQKLDIKASKYTYNRNRTYLLLQKNIFFDI